jgi:hypothetical protein
VEKRQETTDFLTPDGVRTLVEHSGGPCVSIYMPLRRAGKEVRQNPIRYRNLLRHAEETVRARVAQGNTGVDVDGLFAPARRLADRPGFWERSGKGLAVLFDPETMHRIRLVEDQEELALVASEFHVLPLLARLADDLRYHVLDLNRHHARLFRGSSTGLDEVDPGDAPRDYRDVVGRDREEQHLQWRTGTGGGAASSAKRAALFHGQGGGDDDVEVELRRFVAALEPSVRRVIGESDDPLLLAGLEPMPALYREKNRYPHLLEQDLQRNVAQLGPDELFEAVGPVVDRLRQTRREEAAAGCRSLIGTDRASADLAEIVAAADDGRIDTLFVARGRLRWGRWRRADRKVELAAGPGPPYVDLLNLAASRTFLSGGTVYVVDPEEVPAPGEALAVASFRYPGPPAGTSGGR